VLQIPALGQRLDRIEARVTVADEKVTLERLQASGVVGRLTASGSAEIRGAEDFEAEASVVVAEDEKVPVTLEGVSYGEAWGRVRVSVGRAPDRETQVLARVERLHLVLPEMSPTGVQGLEPAEAIRVGAYQNEGRFVALPLQPVREGTASEPVVVRVDLGREIWISRGTKLSARFGGELTAKVGEETEVEGRVDIRGGTLDVSGKRFHIERGVITLQGTPEQAVITATARWDSPEGYSVYAELSGTVADARIDLRSDPPLADDQILSLLLFGTPNAGVGSASPNEAGTAAAIAGDTATRGVNQLLSRFSDLDVSTRVDTSTGSARPELVVQLTPRLTARVTRALGEPPPGQSPDVTFLTLELRIQARWSISTIVGDHGGTAFEAVWRYSF
jgi:translocation and assembly module TamB